MRRLEGVEWLKIAGMKEQGRYTKELVLYIMEVFRLRRASAPVEEKSDWRNDGVSEMSWIIQDILQNGITGVEESYGMDCGDWWVGYNERVEKVLSECEVRISNEVVVMELMQYSVFGAGIWRSR